MKERSEEMLWKITWPAAISQYFLNIILLENIINHKDSNHLTALSVPLTLHLDFPSPRCPMSQSILCLSNKFLGRAAENQNSEKGLSFHIQRKAIPHALNQ